jgi:Fe-S-cluster containining protein
VSETLRDHMPPLYAPMLAGFFDRAPIAETRATCDDCAMCDRSDKSGTSEPSPALDTAFFRPDLKCCTYHPTLPNYLVGAVLSDESSELAPGKTRLREKIARRIGVTPEWLAAPRKYLVLLDAARESSFGRSESLLCPYYERETGRCSIWRHRESVCATFFCKHSAGATGHAFWTALRRYLYHVERTLAGHAAKSVDPSLVEPSLPRHALTREDLEDKPARDYERTWGTWVHREEALYVACAEKVRSMGREEFARVVDDAGGTALLRAAEAAYAAVASPELAPRLVRNDDMRVVPAAGGVGVTTYSRYDSLFLTQDLYDLVGQFRDEPLGAEVERLEREHDVEIPASLLLELQLHGVLTPPNVKPKAP